MIWSLLELLQKIDLEDATISIDAIGCQKNIAEQLLEGGVDCILAVKEHQDLL